MVDPIETLDQISSNNISFENLAYINYLIYYLIQGVDLSYLSFESFLAGEFPPSYWEN